MVLRHVICLLLSILLFSPLALPASGQTQDALVPGGGPSYGLTLGPFAIMAFDWHLPGAPRAGGAAVESSRGLGDWPTHTLPPILYAYDDGSAPHLFMIDLGDTMPAIQHPGLGLTALPIGGSGRWTIGLLAGQAGGGAQTDYLSRFGDPFVSYTTLDATTVLLTSESACGMLGRQTSLPVNFIVTRPAGAGTSASIGAGVCYWNDSTDAGSRGAGLRIGMTIPFP